MHEPLDKDYSNPYAPITGRNLYCGDAAALPAGYDAFGSNAECLQIGVGIGKRIKFEKGVIVGDLAMYVKMFVIVFVMSVLWFYNYQPSIVTTTSISIASSSDITESEGVSKVVDELSWLRVILFSLVVGALTCVVVMGIKVLSSTF